MTHFTAQPQHALLGRADEIDSFVPRQGRGDRAVEGRPFIRLAIVRQLT